MNRANARPRRQQGFTLIEVVLALAIFAVAIGLCMQIATSSLKQARVAAEQTHAALLAQSLLDTSGVGERLQPGRTSGRLEGDYRWELDVSPFEAELQADSALTPGLLAVQLFRLELSLSWPVGERRREMKFSTLRAMTPDPNVPVSSP